MTHQVKNPMRLRREFALKCNMAMTRPNTFREFANYEEDWYNSPSSIWQKKQKCGACVVLVTCGNPRNPSRNDRHPWHSPDLDLPRSFVSKRVSVAMPANPCPVKKGPGCIKVQGQYEVFHMPSLPCTCSGCRTSVFRKKLVKQSKKWRSLRPLWLETIFCVFFRELHLILTFSRRHHEWSWRYQRSKQDRQVFVVWVTHKSYRHWRLL